MEYNFTEATRGVLIQARHELQALNGSVLEPSHLALAALKLDPAFAPDCIAHFIQANDADPELAPAIGMDVPYSGAAKAALAGAAWEANARGEAVGPLHVLLGILRPRTPGTEAPVPAGVTAATLAAAGITESAIVAVLEARFIARPSRPADQPLRPFVRALAVILGLAILLTLPLLLMTGIFKELGLAAFGFAIAEVGLALLFLYAAWTGRSPNWAR